MITPETHNNSTVLLDELTSIVRNFSMDDLEKLEDVQLLEEILFLEKISPFLNQFKEEMFSKEFWRSKVVKNYQTLFSNTPKIPTKLTSQYSLLIDSDVLECFVILNKYLVQDIDGISPSRIDNDLIMQSLRGVFFVSNSKKLPVSIREAFDKAFVKNEELHSYPDRVYYFVNLLKENEVLIEYLTSVNNLIGSVQSFNFSISYSLNKKTFYSLTDLRKFSDDYCTPVGDVFFGFNVNVKNNDPFMPNITDDLKKLFNELQAGKTSIEALLSVFKNKLENWIVYLNNALLLSDDDIIKELKNQRIPVDLVSDKQLEFSLTYSIGRDLLQFYYSQETKEGRSRIKDSILKLFDDFEKEIE